MNAAGVSDRSGANAPPDAGEPDARSRPRSQIGLKAESFGSVRDRRKGLRNGADGVDSGAGRGEGVGE